MSKTPLGKLSTLPVFGGAPLVSQKAFVKLFYKSQPPYKFVNLSLMITNMQNKMTDLYWNRLLQNDLINTFCELNSRHLRFVRPSFHEIPGYRPLSRVLSRPLRILAGRLRG